MALNQKPIPFVGPGYKARSIDINAQRTVNFYLELGGPDGATAIALLPTPGLTQLVQFPGDLEIRGQKSWHGYNWVVAGGTLYRVAPDWTFTTIGAIATTMGPVSMDVSTDQLMLVDGDRGYYYDFPSSTFGVITDVELPSGARTVTYLAAKFVVEIPNTQSFAWSAINDARVWDGADFASAEANPDNLVAVRSYFGQLYAIGTSTTQVFQPDSLGYANTQQYIGQGCAAPFSVVEVDNAMFLLQSDENGQGQIVRIAGYQSSRASDFGVEEAIRLMIRDSRIDDAIAYAYTEAGHPFYVITFPTANQTWALDIATKTWHERLAFDSVTGAFLRHRSNCYALFNSKHVVGDFANGKLYALDLDNYTDNGAAVLRLRATQTLVDGERAVSYGALQVACEAGVGLPTWPLDRKPQLMLRFSNDGGHTWSNRRVADIGRVGNYGQRCRWNRNGQGAHRVWEVSCSDPVKIVIKSAVVETTL